MITVVEVVSFSKDVVVVDIGMLVVVDGIIVVGVGVISIVEGPGIIVVLVSPLVLD